VEVWKLSEVSNLVVGKTSQTRKRHAVIDVDVHEAFKSIKDLVPYLEEPWKTLVRNGAFKGFTQPFIYWATGGGNRADAYPEKGGNAGSDFKLLHKQLFDSFEVEYAMLTGYFYPVMLKMQDEFATALASAYNDYQVEHWLARDKRLLGSIHVAPQDPVGAAREIDRMASHSQMIQVMLPIADIAYGEKQYFPIFEAAQRNGMVIALHHTVNVEGSLGMGKYYIERHCLIPQGMMAEVYSLVFSGVFEKFPDLKVVCLEGGFSWLPHVMFRADREYKSLRQEVPWMKRLPSEYISDHIRFATQPVEDMNAKEWMHIMDLIDNDKMLMFATDYPHFDFDNPLRALPAGLPYELKRKILYENAREFYEL
jgi:predicted TIM-barrel fold metal-dependent hydrolase